MHVELLLTMLFELLEKRRVTASSLAEKYSLSVRTVYRQVEKLSKFLPLYIKRGRSGGICLADSYRLPAGFFTREEFSACADALQHAYAQTGEERFLRTLRKLRTGERQEELPSYIAAEIGQITLLPDKSDKENFSLLYVLQACVKEKTVAELLLRGEKNPRLTEPVALLLQKGVWSVVTFCRECRNFLTLPLTELRGVRKTEEVFQPRSIHFALPMYEAKSIF